MADVSHPAEELHAAYAPPLAAEPEAAPGEAGRAEPEAQHSYEAFIAELAPVAEELARVAVPESGIAAAEPLAVPGAADADLTPLQRAQLLAAQFASGAGQQEEGDGKRKYEEDAGGEDPFAKRQAYDYAAIDAANQLPGPPGAGLEGAVLGGFPALYGSVPATEVLVCPHDKVGRIIGRAGVTIKELQDRTATRIQVDHKAPGGDKPVTISGQVADVERCKQMILALMEGSDAGLSSVAGGGGGGGGGLGLAPPGVGEGEPLILQCPQGIVGRIIGRGGETIRSLQQASGAHILINQDFPEGHPRQITISGRADAIDRAQKMVMELVSGDPGTAQQVVQKYGLGQTEHMECPKQMVGRVIGKAGETIKTLQKQFNVSIQIDQNQMPCGITMTGAPQSLAAARRAIEELINPMSGGMGGEHQIGMGGGAYGGAPGGAYGGAPAVGYGQGYPGMQAAYGGYNPAAAAYGAQQAYGGQAAYGGYNPAAAAYGGAAYGGFGGAQQGGGDAYGGQAAAYGGGGGLPAPGGRWQALQDGEGRTYYYDSTTGVSQWEKPADMH